MIYFACNTIAMLRDLADYRNLCRNPGESVFVVRSMRCVHVVRVQNRHAQFRFPRIE